MSAERLLAVAVAAVLAAVAASPVAAKSSDRQKPMDIQADRNSGLLADDGTQNFEGNVQIRQGTLEIDADKAEIHTAAGDIREVIFTGRPARLRQVADNGDRTDASAQRIVYTLANELMVLTGDVVIRQPRGTMRAQTVKYDVDSGRLDGGGDGERISLRILPRGATDAD